MYIFANHTTPGTTIHIKKLDEILFPVRQLQFYANYGPDQETIDYAQPFLDEEFRGENVEFIGALYYVGFPLRTGGNRDATSEC